MERSHPATVRTMLRVLTSSGFDILRDGVVLNGLSDSRQVTVVVSHDAIRASFPKIGTPPQCVAFVEKNIVPLRDMANARLKAGTAVDLPLRHGYARADVLVSLTIDDLSRSRRWLTP